jgi:MFS family permease
LSDRAVSLDEPPADSIWGNRPFMFLWTAQAISQTAQNAIWFALMVLIEETTHSTAQLGIAIVSFILPSVVFTVPAGVLVDRVDKRLVLVATNWLRAVAVLGYVVFSQSLSVIYSVTFVFSVISQFFLPAEAAMIPALVGRSKLITANSLFNLTFTLSQLVGIVFLAPILIKFFGTQTLFILISVLLALCGILVFTLPRRASKDVTSAQPDGVKALQRFVDDLKETWRFLAADQMAIMAMVLLTCGATLSLITAMLAPRYMVTIVGIRADDTVYVLAPAGVGMALGAAIISRLSKWVPKELLIVTGVVVVAAGLLLLAVVGPVWNFLFIRILSVLLDPASMPRIVSLVSMVMAIAAITGFALSMMIISSQTILQERAPVESRGRIFAAQIMLGNVASILPLVFVGAMADAFGVSQVLAVLAALMLVLAYVSFRSYRERIWGDVDEPLTPR